MPSSGMNLDSSPSQVGADYCVYSNNMITSEPGQIRQRRGWLRGASHASRFTTPANGDIFGTAVLQSANAGYALLNLLENDSAWTGGSTSGTARPTIVVYESATPSVSAPNTTAFSKLMPVNQYVTYNNAVYFIGEDTTGSNLSRLARWSGRADADITTGGTTISNGSTSGTLSTSVGATQLGGMFLCVTGGATGPGANYRYVYRIKAGTASAYTLYDAYGLGENTTNVPNAVGASTTISIRSITEVPYCPQGAKSVGLFRDRLFTCGGYKDVAQTEFYYNIIRWSKPGELEKWPDQNFALVGDEADPLVGFATVPDGMLIFSTTKTFLLTGYDEDSFSLRQISGQVGCAVPSSVTYANNRAYWMSHDGIYSSDGGTPASLTSPRRGVGIQTQYFREMNASQEERNFSISCFSGMTVVDNRLQVAFNTPASGGKSMLTCDLRNGAWGEWGSDTQEYNPIFFARQGSQVWGIGVWNSVDITNCFGPEKFITLDATAVDAQHTSAGATVDTNIVANIDFSDFRLGTDTVRLKGIQFEHNCHYADSVSDPHAAWEVSLSTDDSPDDEITDIGDIAARYVGFETTAVNFDKYYVTEFRDTASLEGALFRISLNKPSVYTNSNKIYRIYLLTDPRSTTSVGRVDNPSL